MTAARYLSAIPFMVAATAANAETAAAPVAPVTVAAPAEVITPPVSPWKAAADVGYIRSSGSTGTKETFRSKLFGEYKQEKWLHEGKIEAIYTSDENSADSDIERYLAGTKSKRSFTPKDYFFIQSQWEKDLQSNFDYQAFLSAGYGRNILTGDVHKLSAEIGAGWRHSELRVGESSTDEIIANTGFDYRWQINAATSFQQKVAIEAGEENVVTRSLTELKHKLTTAMAMGVSYDYKYDDAEVNTREGIFSFNVNYVFR